MVDSQVIEEVEAPSSQSPTFIHASHQEKFMTPQEEAEQGEPLLLGSAADGGGDPFSKLYGDDEQRFGGGGKYTLYTSLY